MVIIKPSLNMGGLGALQMWLHTVQDVTSVAFVANLCGCDERLVEDGETVWDRC